jgi:hypothetical protein
MTTYKAPIDLATVSFPLGVDVQIQALQAELKSELVWLEYSFGRAFVGRSDQAKGKDYTYPMVYRGNKDYQDASPNDNLNSASFFVVDGDYSYDEYDINEPNKMSVPVSLIIWGDLKKISPDYDEHFGGILLQDVLRVIRNNEEVKVNRISDNVQEVFKEFSVRDDVSALFYYPYFCYRISLEVATQEDCELDIRTALKNYNIIPSTGFDYTLDFPLS